MLFRSEVEAEGEDGGGLNGTEAAASPADVVSALALPVSRGSAPNMARCDGDEGCEAIFSIILEGGGRP